MGAPGHGCNNDLADAPHSFLNDTMPGRYRESPTLAAWSQILSFLDATLDKGWDKERVVGRFESDTSVHYDFTENRRWEQSSMMGKPSANRDRYRHSLR